ncbi:UNKNOWN [Stylonychia lemnae]|uniref:Uncharacterized protein n=1 Tax=Stylonychia lemnae TaxID=5949 RepID=A0A077ZVR7_STYLE|nr:UNKNOWN [Stylonychia lemnae]|eukprot:CDW73711.1 UNKNOWN [Stylonychia lemnae]
MLVKDRVEFVMPDIQLNSKIFNPNKKKSKVEESNQLRDLKYQYFQKHEDARKAYRAQRQFSSKDTQIKFSKYRDSASFLLLYRKALGHTPGQVMSPQHVHNLITNKIESNQQSTTDNEKAKDKVMTIEDLIGEFTKENEDQMRQFIVDRSLVKLQSNYSQPNQGISQAIDKTFSRVETEKNPKKSEEIKNKIRKRLQSANLLQRKKSKSASMKSNTAVYTQLEGTRIQDFEAKLKQAIIDRLDDKEKFLNFCDINNLVMCLKESKMSIENELDDLKQIKQEIHQLNSVSKIDATKVDKKISQIKFRLKKLKLINDEQMIDIDFENENGKDQPSNNSFLLKQNSKNPNFNLNFTKSQQDPNKLAQQKAYRERLKSASINKKPQNTILKQRLTNKNLSIKEQLEFEGIKEEDLNIREEFKQLRGTHGIKKSILEQDLDQDLELYQQKTLFKKIPKEIDTHAYFIKNSTRCGAASQKKRRSTSNMLYYEDKDNSSSLISIPDSPLYSDMHYQKMEFIKSLKEKQDKQRQLRKLRESQDAQNNLQLQQHQSQQNQQSSQAEGFQRKSSLGNSSMVGFNLQRVKNRPQSSVSNYARATKTPLTAQRFYMNQQALRQQKTDLINKSYDYAKKEQQMLCGKTMNTGSMKSFQTRETPYSHVHRTNTQTYSKQMKVSRDQEDSVASYQSYLDRKETNKMEDTITISPYSIGIRTVKTAQSKYNN